MKLTSTDGRNRRSRLRRNRRAASRRVQRLLKWSQEQKKHNFCLIRDAHEEMIFKQGKTKLTFRISFLEVCMKWNRSWVNALCLWESYGTWKIWLTCLCCSMWGCRRCFRHSHLKWVMHSWEKEPIILLNMSTRENLQILRSECKEQGMACWRQTKPVKSSSHFLQYWLSKSVHGCAGVKVLGSVSLYWRNIYFWHRANIRESSCWSLKLKYMKGNRKSGNRSLWRKKTVYRRRKSFISNYRSLEETLHKMGIDVLNAGCEAYFGSVETCTAWQRKVKSFSNSVHHLIVQRGKFSMERSRRCQHSRKAMGKNHPSERNLQEVIWEEPSFQGIYL